MFAYLPILERIWPFQKRSQLLLQLCVFIFLKTTKSFVTKSINAALSEWQALWLTVGLYHAAKQASKIQCSFNAWKMYHRPLYSVTFHLQVLLSKRLGSCWHRTNANVQNHNSLLQLCSMYLLLVSLLKVSRNEPSTQALFATAIFSRHATLYTISTRTMYTGHSFVSPLIKNSSYYNRAGRRKVRI